MAVFSQNSSGNFLLSPDTPAAHVPVVDVRPPVLLSSRPLVVEQLVRPTWCLMPLLNVYSWRTPVETMLSNSAVFSSNEIIPVCVLCAPMNG